MSNMGSFETSRFVEVDIRKLTPEQLMQFGMADLAYVKPVFLDGQTAFAIHAPTGRRWRWQPTAIWRWRRSFSMK